MTETKPCQRPDCDQPGKPRTMTDPESGKTATLYLCDDDYNEAREKEQPPRWLSELLTHIGLVG